MRFGEFEIDRAQRELRRSGEIVEVEPQVFDVLTYLAEHRERAVSKIELLDEVWGTRFVTESALTSRIKSARRALGDSGREQKVIKTLYGHGYRFVAEIDAAGDGPPDTSRVATSPVPVGSVGRIAVVAPLNSFVGRADDLARLRSVVSEHRLVSVVGPPGVGATRLATELAASWDGPAALVDLTDGRPPLAAIAAALGVSDADEDRLVEGCVTALDSERTLLVADAVDRADPATADVLAELLGAVFGLRVVATARTAIGRSDEIVHRIGPLDHDRATSSSVELFLARTAAALPADPTAEELETVDRICRRLDGLPLAIELAASRLQHMTLDDLDRALDDHFDAIAQGAVTSGRDSLDSTFEWSWNALDESERDMLAALSVVAGDFDLAVAEAVGGPDGPALTLRLLDRSLLAPGADRTATYRFLDTLRPFVRTHSDEELRHTAARRLLAHVVGRVEDVAELVRTDDSAEMMAAAAAARSSATAMLRSAPREPAGPVLRLATALATIADQTGSDAETAAVLLRIARDDDLLSAATTRQLGTLATFCDSNDTGRLAELSVWALRRAVDDHDRMVALEVVGTRHANAGRLDEALDALDEAAEIAGRLDDTPAMAEILVARGMAHRAVGDGREAIDAFLEAGSTYARAGNRLHVSNCRYLAARTAADTGLDTDDAVAWAEQSIAYGEETGNDHERAHGQLVRAALPRCAEPVSTITDALGVFRRVGDLRCVVRAHLALADHRDGDERIASLVDALAAADLDRDDRAVERCGVTLIEALLVAGRRADAAMVWGAVGQPNPTSTGFETDLSSMALRPSVDEGAAGGLARTIERLRG